MYLINHLEQHQNKHPILHPGRTSKAFQREAQNALAFAPIEFPFSQETPCNDPLTDSINECFQQLKSEIPTLTGIQLSNPLVEVYEEIGEYSQFNETFAIVDGEIWRGELTLSLCRAPTNAEQILLSELTHRYLSKINSGLKNHVEQFEDLTARSLLHPDPSIIENLFFREGRLCIRFGHAFSLLFVSCDQYHETLLKHGAYHAASLLAKFCQRLTKGIRDYDFVLRYSENEFCILLNQVDIEKANQIATRINNGFSDQHLALDENRIPLSASIGIAEINPKETVEHTLKIAQHAMHLAEKRGGDQFVYSDGCFLY